MRDNPNFSLEQVDRIRSVAQLRSLQDGEVLYEPSQPDVPLFIALEGNVPGSGTGDYDKTPAVRKQTSSPARCPSFSASARSSMRASPAMAAAGQDYHF
jgi:hypothetical protein